MINPSREKRRTVQSATQWLHSEMMVQFLKVVEQTSMSRCINFLVAKIPFSCFFSITYTQDDMGKPGSDAGMPGIEDSEVGKIEDAQFGEYHKVNL